MTHSDENGRVPPPEDGGEGDAHYQPWLRNQPAAAPAPGGVTRPQPLPTRDASAPNAPTRDAGAPRATPDQRVPDPRETADDMLARPVAMPGTPPVDDGPGIGDKMREAMDKAGDAIERAELGRRAREAGEKGGALARRGAEVAGRALRSAAKATGDAAHVAAERAGPALKAAAEKIGEGTTRAGEAIGEGGRKAGEAARRALDAAPMGDRRGEPAPPPSQLDRLLAEEAQGGHAAPEMAPPPPPLSAVQPTPSQPVEDPSTLPLFSGAAPADTPNEPDVSMTHDPSSAAAQAGAAAAAATAAPAYTASNAAPARPATTGGGGAGKSGGRLGGGDWARHPGTWMLGGLALVLAGFVGGTIWSDGVNDRATVERIIDDHLLNNPEILPRAMERLQANVMAQKVAQHRAALTRPYSGAWAGAADGDVTLVVFTDYACGFCRASEPDIERLIREDRKLKVVFRELPIISPESEPAARLALVAARAGRVMDVHSALFAAGNPTQQSRNTVAERFNLGADEASMNNPGITAELRSNITLAQQMGIDGTPTWIIGDRVLTGAVGYDALRDAIRAAREKK